MGMAHSVEGRFPFLDHRVVEFCNRLAPRLKLCGLTEKHVLKRAVSDLLPELIWNRPKRPYRAPIHASFFPGGKPLDWVVQMLSPKSIRAVDCFNPEAVSLLQRKLERIGSLGETDDMALAGVLSTQLVHQHFVSGFPTPQGLGDDDRVKVVRRNQGSPRSPSTD